MMKHPKPLDVHEVHRHDYKVLLHDFVDAINAYDKLDPSWTYPTDKRVEDAWHHVRDVTRRLHFVLALGNHEKVTPMLTDEEIDSEIFGWTHGA